MVHRLVFRFVLQKVIFTIYATLGVVHKEYFFLFLYRSPLLVSSRWTEAVIRHLCLYGPSFLRRCCKTGSRRLRPFLDPGPLVSLPICRDWRIALFSFLVALCASSSPRYFQCLMAVGALFFVMYRESVHWSLNRMVSPRSLPSSC